MKRLLILTGDVIGFSNREENLKLSDAAVQLMIRTFEEFAKLEKSLILEANFHKRELQQLQDIAKTYDYEVMTLVLEAECSETDTELTVGGGYLIRCGTAIQVRGPGYAGSGTILSIERGNQQ